MVTGNKEEKKNNKREKCYEEALEYIIGNIVCAAGGRAKVGFCVKDVGGGGGG